MPPVTLVGSSRIHHHLLVLWLTGHAKPLQSLNQERIFLGQNYEDHVRHHLSCVLWYMEAQESSHSDTTWSLPSRCSELMESEFMPHSCHLYSSHCSSTRYDDTERAGERGNWVSLSSVYRTGSTRLCLQRQSFRVSRTDEVSWEGSEARSSDGLQSLLKMAREELDGRQGRTNSRAEQAIRGQRQAEVGSGWTGGVNKERAPTLEQVGPAPIRLYI